MRKVRFSRLILRPGALALEAISGVLILLVATLLPVHAAAPSKTSTTTIQILSKREYLTGSLVEIAVTSPEPDYPLRKIYTWTPPIKNIDSASLPVVYLLHGWPGSPLSMIAGVTTQLLKLFQTGTRPFIAAFPDGNAKTHVDSEWADSSDSKAMIETWLTTNAITAVEGSRVRSRSERAIAGFSMGGYGAAIIALHHPDLYSQVVTLAGYFLVDDLTAAFKGPAKIAYQNPNNFMAAAKKLRWYVAEAKDDFTTPIRGEMARWSKKLTALKIPVMTSSPFGGHSFAFVGSEALIFGKWFIWPPAPLMSPSPSASTSPATPATETSPASSSPLASSTP